MLQELRLGAVLWCLLLSLCVVLLLLLLFHMCETTAQGEVSRHDTQLIHESERARVPST